MRAHRHRQRGGPQGGPKGARGPSAGRPDPRPPPGPPAEFAVEAVGGEGDGVAAGPVFIPFALPGERVLAQGTGERRELVEVLVSSADRVTPPCPHFFLCGGCALQHWAHAPYLAWKVERLVGTLARERIETEILAPVAAGPGTRRRITLHARKGGPEAARLGYKQRKSWDLVDIDACPIADPQLEAAIPALKRLAARLFEHPKSSPSLHVTVTDGGLDIDITGVEARSGGLSADARMLLAERAAEADFAWVTLAGEVAYMSRQPTIRIGRATVALPPGAFLQAVPAAEAAMVAFACDAAAGAHRIADLYCGVGAFALRLAEIAPVLAADSARPAVAALAAAVATAPGLKAVTAETRDLARRPMLAADLRHVDVAVFDPPRAGALEQAREIAASRVARVVGVSCNPATFVRDARILVDAGFRLDRVLPVDQFLWSPHVELVGVFSR